MERTELEAHPDNSQQRMHVRRSSSFKKPLNAQLTIHYRPREGCDPLSSSDSSLSSGSSKHNASLEDELLPQRGSPLDFMQVIKTELSIEEEPLDDDDDSDSEEDLSQLVKDSPRYYSLSPVSGNTANFLPIVEDDEEEEEGEEIAEEHDVVVSSISITNTSQDYLSAFCNLHQCTSDHPHARTLSYSSAAGGVSPGTCNCFQTGDHMQFVPDGARVSEHEVNVKYITAQQRPRGSQASLSTEGSGFHRSRAASCPANDANSQRGSVPRIYAGAHMTPYTEMALVEEPEGEECEGCREHGHGGHAKCEFDDLSSPCHRHHHRRNSIAIRFSRPLYKKL